jgi:hypothetical protein
VLVVVHNLAVLVILPLLALLKVIQVALPQVQVLRGQVVLAVEQVLRVEIIPLAVRAKLQQLMLPLLHEEEEAEEEQLL